MTQAFVLRRVREAKKQWWWFVELRKQGKIAEAQKLERESIRSTIKLMKLERIDEISMEHLYVTFHKREATEQTVSISNVSPSEMLAWQYVRDHKLGANRD